MEQNLKAQAVKTLEGFLVRFPSVPFWDRVRIKTMSKLCTECRGRKCIKCKWKGRTYYPTFFNTRRYEDLKNAIKLVCKAAGNPDYAGPVEITILAYFEIPKSRKDVAKHDPYLNKPDEDNISKIWKDAFEGIAYLDDKQVWKSSVQKVYTNEESRTLVLINYSSGKEIKSCQHQQPISMKSSNLSKNTVSQKKESTI